MTSNVIQFETREERQPHKTGYARCITCGFEYVAVAPVGIHHMDCPSCKFGMAFFVYPIEPSQGDMAWTCNNCQCQAFSSIIRNGKHFFWCCGCGQNITPDDFLGEHG